MEYYFTSESSINHSASTLILTGQEFKHLSKVLRKKQGDLIDVTDGKLNVYHCKISSIETDKISCDILSKDHNIGEPEIELTVYFSLLKNMERYEFGVEKLVELGVKKIIPLITERTIIKEELSVNKLARLNKIVLSAVSQSQRCFLPVIENAIKLKDLIPEEGAKNYFMYEFSNEEKKIETILQKKVTIIIGPEGGFTEHEADMLSKKGWNPASLGKRKFRAETAAIVAASQIFNI